MSSSHLPVVIGLFIYLSCLTLTTGDSGLPHAQSAGETGQRPNAPTVGLEAGTSDEEETMEDAVRKQEETLTLLRETVQQQKSLMQSMSQRMDYLQRLVSTMMSACGEAVEYADTDVSITSLANATISGVSYVRWGRTQCEGTAVPLYTGYAAGGQTGYGSTDPICLIENPATGNTAGYTTVEIRAVEYYFHSDPFSTANAGNDDLLYENAPCVLCHVLSRSDTFMLPGHNSCPIGWTVEYSGYLVSTNYGNVASSSFMCMDDAPEVAIGGINNQAAYEVYATVPDCSSVECPPYYSSQCIPCAVCTR